MVAFRKILGRTLTGFLPSLLLAMIALLIIEPLVRGHDVIRSLRGIFLPLAIAEPLLMTAGFLLGLWLLKRRIDERLLDRTVLHVCAAILALIVMAAISVMSQGAHLPWIVSVSIGSGLLSALICFGMRRQPRTAAAL